MMPDRAVAKYRAIGAGRIAYANLETTVIPAKAGIQ
jgi:hypothetical protein